MEHTNRLCNCYTLKCIVMRPNKRSLNVLSVRFQIENYNVHVPLLCCNKRVVRSTELPLIRQI